MASQHHVRQYLAYWFQLGKRVIVRNGHESLLPQPVIAGDRYSSQFEQCWQHILANADQSYLESTDQSIAELLSSAWEIDPCSRCSMPVPVASLGMPALSCPCVDLPLWPNTDAPSPRAPVSSRAQLVQIRDRLKASSKEVSADSDQSQAS